MRTYSDTHPLVWCAAAGVTIIGLLVAAAVTGILPNARSGKTEVPAQKYVARLETVRPPSVTLVALENACASCGTVAAIRTAESAGEPVSGVEIGRSSKKHLSFRITVRMDDGSYRTLSQPYAPAVAVGEPVRIVNGALIARS